MSISKYTIFVLYSIHQFYYMFHTYISLIKTPLSLLTACFGRLEEHCSSLQVTRGQLERLWEEKGSQLDKILQLRVFEHDSEQMSQWIRHEATSLAHNHTDIGDTLSTAELRRQAFEDFRTRMKV